MSDINQMTQPGYIGFNLNSINNQFIKLYGSSTGNKPTKADLLSKYPTNFDKYRTDLTVLPPKATPLGLGAPDYSFQANKPLLSDQKYKAQPLHTGLNTPINYQFAFQREQVEKTNEYLARNQYNRLMSNRTNDGQNFVLPIR
jgi:hypothetical protein